MHRYLGPGLKGLLYGAGFGIISSSCSYGAAAAARGFYQKGADVRSVFSFLISSTNMNLAILILFWSLLGWKFAFAEFFGGVIIIVVVTLGFTLLFRRGELERLQICSTPAAARRRWRSEAQARRGWDVVASTASRRRAHVADGTDLRISHSGVCRGADTSRVAFGCAARRRRRSGHRIRTAARSGFADRDRDIRLLDGQRPDRAAISPTRGYRSAPTLPSFTAICSFFR